ncbi:Siah2p [Homalodisca vitripennis]|nr:Siah2p [Homalodisca vitripennis]
MVNRSFQKILDIARCAVCLETARPKIVQCEGEHILCGVCSKHLKECPTCKRPFSRAKLARIMSQVLDALPKLCKHTNCGVYVSDDDEHEKWCGFQSTLCALCGWPGARRDILSHVQRGHPSQGNQIAAAAWMTMLSDPVLASGLCWTFKPLVPSHTLKLLLPLRGSLMRNRLPGPPTPAVYKVSLRYLVDYCLTYYKELESASKWRTVITNQLDTRDCGKLRVA